ncbi:MAG: hypothetical protein M1828_006254 [Chrysothrix sp. TS-e1954]|nr:MAG: hypothetical protein M1828_006254 [Chrysothrix sp. TS-e1954]
MASLPFKVKAVFEYKSPHDDDLSFPNGQIITVTDEEDADWYVGEYVDDDGGKQDGMFPRNFVEKYEPAAPPRPSRPRPKKESAPAAEPAVEPARAEPEFDETEEARELTPSASVTTAGPRSTEESRPSVPAEKTPESKAEAAKPTTGPKAPPPAVASKPASSAFKDRIAAFNRPSEAPVAPSKQGGLLSGPSAPSFVKKPFVAPPPSKDAYVPPPRENTTAKVYRREEDPEIAERRVQDQENATQAGLAGNNEQEEAEEAPKATSLKDRIALLQKQQQEQAARRAESGSKEKAKRPAPPRAESSNRSLNQADEEGAQLRNVGSHGSARQSMDEPLEIAKPTSNRKMSREIPNEPARSEIISDGNEADQSGAGDTTEDAEGTSTEVDESDEKHESVAPKPPARSSTQLSGEAVPMREPHSHETEDHADEGAKDDEEEGEEEETEEERDARRKAELRQRMAKMSGGMGMAGMFGAASGMSAAGGASKKASGSSRAVSGDKPSSPPPPPQRVPMVPVPGTPRAQDSRSTQGELSVGKEREITSMPSMTERPPGEVADVEDLEPQPSALEPQPMQTATAPPIPQDRPIRAPSLTQQRGAPPPVPGDRPAPPPPDSRPVPPPPPRTSTMPLAQEEEESEEDEPQQGQALPSRPIPEGPRSPPRFNSKRASHPVPPPPSSPPTSVDKRASRPPPPIPSGSPTMSPSDTRGLPPPPPTQTRPTRQSTNRDSVSTSEQRNAAESDYEGDYDTDIASGATHKDALKSKPSYDEGTLSEAPGSPAPPPPPTHRSVPPPPPPTQQVPSLPRKSGEAPRAPPPVPPPREEGDDDYDPYHYSSTPPVVSPKSRGPEYVQQESEPSFYSQSPKMSERAPPLPPQDSPAQKHPAPPPLPPHHTAASAVQASPSQSREIPRQSVDMPSRASTNLSRRSMEASRPAGDQGYMARDVDLAEPTQWWTVPNGLPPTFQNRVDILSETEETSTNKRGGHTIVSKDVYVLFTDYSQTVITAQFDPKVPNQHVTLEQRHEPPPPRLRQDQLETIYPRFGQPIAAAAAQHVSSIVADGHPQALVLSLFKVAAPGALLPVGMRAYGAIVYANLANASVQQYDEMRPGDIITFRNAKFSGKHGAMHAKYSQDVGRPDHVAVVAEWDGTKKKIRAWEQGRSDKEGKEAGKEARKVKLEGFKLGDLRSGEVRVWRVVGRDYVGWDGNS